MKKYSTLILFTALVILYLIVNNQSFLLSEPVLDESKNVIMIASIFFTMAFFVFAVTMYVLFIKASKQPLSMDLLTGKPVSNIMLGTAVIFFLGFIVISIVNRELDSSETSVRNVQILSKEERGKTARIRVTPWNKDKLAETILFDKRFFNDFAEKAEEGKEVVLHTKRGAFSIERIEKAIFKEESAHK